MKSERATQLNENLRIATFHLIAHFALFKIIQIDSNDHTLHTDTTGKTLSF
jgi:hypothetical protein